MFPGKSRTPGNWREAISYLSACHSEKNHKAIQLNPPKGEYIESEPFGAEGAVAC
jgi:hypothetical protein